MYRPSMSLIACVAMALVACVSEKPVECKITADCNLHAGGSCDLYEPTGNLWCTYPDGECPSGRRWSDFNTGDGLDGVCQDEQTGADAGVDGSIPDASAMDAGVDASPDAMVPVPDGGTEPPTRWLLISANAKTDNGSPVEGIRSYVPVGGGYVSDWHSPQNDWARGLAVGDFNGDGHMDFFVANGFGSNRRDRIYLGDGEGSFAIGWTSMEGRYSGQAITGDFTGNGLLDVVVAGSSVRLYSNQGNMTFTASDIVNRTASGIDAIDYNGNGRLDLAVADEDVFVFVNNGNGTFSQVWSNNKFALAHTVKWGDYDGDGLPDIAVGYSYNLAIFKNTGSGFIDVVNSHTEFDIKGRPGSLAWVDYDGDGDLDLVAAYCQYPDGGGACGPAPNRVFRNDGGTFLVGWTSPQSDTTYSLSVADFDGDGRPDLAFGSHGVNRIYRNTGSSYSLYWTSVENENTNAIGWLATEGE